MAILALVFHKKGSPDLYWCTVAGDAAATVSHLFSEQSA
jgi:hypothetical protein